MINRGGREGRGRAGHNRAQAGEGVQSPRSTAAIFQSRTQAGHRGVLAEPPWGQGLTTVMEGLGADGQAAQFNGLLEPRICRPCSLGVPGL